MKEELELRTLVRELVNIPKETEWVEFKHNNSDPNEIGEYISALSNSAALYGKSCAYILWGVDDRSRQIIGTTFCPREAKVGNEELENWLLTQLDPSIDVRIREGEIDSKSIVLFEIQPAFSRPVRFRGVEFVRIGSYKKKLQDHPEKERQLWQIFQRTSFEIGVAVENVTSDDVLSLIDYPNYFRLMDQPLPDNRNAILERLISEKMIFPMPGSRYNISNLGAILFAHDLDKFNRLSRKTIRVIIYRGENRVEAVKEQRVVKGYAIGFEATIAYINDQLPQNEKIGQALRREVRRYPEIAIRELVANALIHQDFNITGSGPMIEVFTDRMEISNPGLPLIDALRFIDEPPRSRNELLASLMRRMKICEERGSGIDKVISQVEIFQLPAPDFRATGDSTVAVLYGPREFSLMDKWERIRACYQHACLSYVSGKRMSNATLRKRLGIKDSNYPLASRIIKDALEVELIKAHAEGSGSKRDATYVPFWA
ncbi:MAG: putative DNA binding domain-containing protein [Nitrospirae bacterium]|nr:putative DNA binding domain-containing protein [Nitrospirota bacterium]MBI3352944.1 putative DNA binding domain-containing protein [Nitrospirota bacterium]